MTLLIPELAARPFLGTSCCVVPAADLLTHELHSFPDLELLEIDASAGAIVLQAGPNAPTLDELLDTLDALGYPAKPSDQASP